MIFKYSFKAQFAVSKALIIVRYLDVNQGFCGCLILAEISNKALLVGRNTLSVKMVVT